MPKQETLNTRVIRIEHVLGEMGDKVNILFDMQIANEKRFADLDERIGALVSSIEELIRKMSEGR